MSEENQTSEENWHYPYTQGEIELRGWDFVGKEEIGRECEQYFGISIAKGYEPMQTGDPIVGEFTLYIWYYESVAFIPIPMPTFAHALETAELLMKGIKLSVKDIQKEHI